MQKNGFHLRHSLLAAIALVSFISAHAQELRPALHTAVDSLLRQGEIRTKEYRFGDSVVLGIGQLATFDELIVLTRHPAPLVRVAALYGLLQRDENGQQYSPDLHNQPRPLVPKPYLHRVLEDHFEDTATVRWRVQWEYSTETTHRISVGELCLNKIGGYWSPTRDRVLSDNYGYRMPEDVKVHFDTLLLLNLPNSWATYRFARIQQLGPMPAWRPIIRQQVEKFGDEVSVCYLAKYQNPDDIDLILANLPAEKSWGMHDLPTRWTPFQYFRHPRLFAYLLEHQPASPNNNATIPLVAAYQTPEAANLLATEYVRAKNVDKKEQWYVLSTLSRAVYEQFASIYAPLYWQMLVENPENSNIRIPDQLWETHADSLAKMYDLWKTGQRGARERATAMFPKLSAHLNRTDAARRVRVVMEQIRPGTNPRMAQQAWETIWLARDSTYTTPLFSLLEKEPLPENRFFVCKIILHQLDEGVRQRLAAFLQQRPALRPNLAAAEKGGITFSDFYHYASKKK